MLSEVLLPLEELQMLGNGTSMGVTDRQEAENLRTVLFTKINELWILLQIESFNFF